MLGELDDTFLGSNGADASDLLNYIISSLTAEQTNYLGKDISMMSELDITDKNKVYDDCKESVGDDTALIYIMNYFNTEYSCNNKIKFKYRFRTTYETHTFYSFEKKCFIEFNWDILNKARLVVKNCFKIYFNLENQSEEFCSNCKKYVNCKCKTNIYKTSDYLIILLNYKKNKTKINIVYDEYIDIKNYVEEYNESKSRNYKDYCYRLVGAIYHSGDSSSYGHYIACCRNIGNENNIKKEEEIYLFNDSYVRTLNFNQIKKFNCSPYILFYEKFYNNNNQYQQYLKK